MDVVGAQDSRCDAADVAEQAGGRGGEQARAATGRPGPRGDAAVRPAAGRQQAAPAGDASARRPWPANLSSGDFSRGSQRSASERPHACNDTSNDPAGTGAENPVEFRCGLCAKSAWIQTLVR